MATMYAETVCALGTRKIESDGIIKGGPAYYIRSVFSGHLGRVLAVFFAVSTIISAGLTNFMVQSNSVASTLNGTFGVPNWVTGIMLALICWFILKGGIERMSFVTEKIVPIMHLISNLYLEYVKKSYNATTKSQTTQFVNVLRI